MATRFNGPDLGIEQAPHLDGDLHRRQVGGCVRLLLRQALHQQHAKRPHVCPRIVRLVPAQLGGGVGVGRTWPGMATKQPQFLHCCW